MRVIKTKIRTTPKIISKTKKCRCITFESAEIILFGWVD